MYKVLIVDDETWVVENYRMGIDWAAHGFEVVDVANNGIEALEKIKTIHPDLVMTDIHMPMMGGLELIRLARKQYPDVEFVVISGYAEFSYAQKALNYGVAGYCLKPIEEADIQLVLGNVKNRLQSRNNKMVDYFAALEEMAAGEADADLLSEYGMHWDKNAGMRVLVCVGKWKESFSGFWSAVVPLGVDRKACFLSDRYLANALNELEQIPDLVVGVSRKVNDIGLVNNALVEAQISAHQSFMTGSAGIYHYQAASRGHLREIIGRLSAAMGKRETVAVLDAFEEMETLFCGEGYNIRHAFYAYNMISDMLFQHGVEDDCYDMVNYQELTSLYSSVKEMLSILQEHCLGVINYGSELDVQAVNNDVVREILKYLHDNYYQDISLRDLADRYFLNPSYLCRTFKKQVGKPFTVYLANLRLRHACELLRATSMSVYEIAERCGYKDYFYFARLFKRTLGVTPSQFRGGENGAMQALN